MTDELSPAAEALFQRRWLDNVKRIDRLFAYLMVGQWIFAIAIAIWFSPYGWAGKTRSIHLHVQIAVGLGALISSAPVALAMLRPGWSGTRYTIAVAQMLWSALLIHLSGGRIETHFHVFGSLAFLAFYRDWRVLVPATVVVAADHFIRQQLWPESVFGISNPESWRFLEHAFWVVFEDVFLVISCLISVQEMRKSAAQQIAVEETERAARDLEIAASIQTSLVPQDIVVPGLEAAARMQPADKVGGDYYDVIGAPGGSWIAIGDVAGHGVRAGLTMLQAQAALAALVRRSPDASPADLWADLNKTFYDNVRNRLRQDEHMTLSLLRYHEDGRVVVAGAHEEILIWRAAKQAFELLPVSGTWIGVSTKAAADEREFRLDIGDLLVLHTDGIIEAKDATGKMIGIERVRDIVERDHAKSVAQIRDAIFGLSTGARDDDASVLVFRYVGVSRVAAAA